MIHDRYITVITQHPQDGISISLRSKDSLGVPKLSITPSFRHTFPQPLAKHEDAPLTLHKVRAPFYIMRWADGSTERSHATMTGYRPLGDTVRGDYARRELKIRSELRMSMNAALGENSPHICSVQTYLTSDPYRPQSSCPEAHTRPCGGR